MKAKRLLIVLMACATCVLLCACPPTPVDTRGPDPDYTTTRTSTKKDAPDYEFLLRKYIDIKPVPSTFEELKALTQARKDANMFYQEYEDHQYVDLVFRRNKFYVARYENVQEFFEKFFKNNTSLDFVKDDDGRVIIKEETHNGPEGMTETFEFRVFVDRSGKFIVLSDNPYVPDSDLNDFFSVDLVSAKEFREFYSIDSKIEDELIEAYIEKNHITRYDLSNEEHGEKLVEIVTNGTYYMLGYSLWEILSVKDVTIPEEEFIKNARLIFFEFEFPVPKSDKTKVENMLFDFRHNKVYYNANVSFYREAEKCVELKEDALKSIQEDLIKNVGPDDGNKYHDLKYSYTVYVIDSEGRYIHYSSRARNSVNTLFDAYWRKLYKTCFGKDHKLVTKGYDPALNEKRGIFRKGN